MKHKKYTSNTMSESDILYQNGNYWVCKSLSGKKGYEVYRDTITHAERCAIIGSDGEEWFKRAKAECDKRATSDLPSLKAESSVRTMTSDIDTNHLDSLNLMLSHERSRLDNAKSEQEKELRKVWVKQLEKEIENEKKFLGIENIDELVTLSDDDLLAALSL